MGKSKAKGDTGKRYTDKQKMKVLDFINSRGRGGIAAAQKKFGISYIAIARWQKGIGLSGQTKAKAGKASATHHAPKASDIQREVQRQIQPHIAQLTRIKAGIKALIQAI
jgi:hypothetical protein